jgi:hypothetical protein
MIHSNGSQRPAQRIHFVNKKHKLPLLLSGIAALLALSGICYWYEAQSVIPADWLVEKVDIAKLEQQEWTRTQGDLPEQWKALKKQMKPGDEIWYYQSPRRFLADEMGYALIRKRKAIAKVVTLVS